MMKCIKTITEDWFDDENCIKTITEDWFDDEMYKNHNRRLV